MSRSYKRPWIKDMVTEAKRRANRRLRRQGEFWDIASGNHYRKFFPQWDISDWSWPAEWRWFEDRHRHWKRLTGNRRAHEWAIRTERNKRTIKTLG